MCNSCIICQSDLPDMYTQAEPRMWVYISGKSQGHMIPLICAMQVNCLEVISHPFQYETGQWIHYIDQLVYYFYTSFCGFSELIYGFWQSF